MKRPWMPLYVDDYFNDTKHLTPEQHGVYLLFLMVAWRRGDGALPNDPHWLRRNLPPMHGRTYNALVPPLLKEFFVLEGDKWVSKRLQKEIEIASKLSRNQSEKASKRWAADKENNDLPDAAAMPSQSHTHTQSQSKKETRVVALSFCDPPDFDEFWMYWPNKVGKPAALRAYGSAMKRGAKSSEILEGVENYIRDKPPDRPWLNPATFLNQNRWEDQPAQVKPYGSAPQANSVSAVAKRWAEKFESQSGDDFEGDTSVVLRLPAR